MNVQDLRSKQYIFRSGDVVEDGVDGFFTVVPSDGTLYVSQQLLVTDHHFLVVALQKKLLVSKI
jgi:hypothetical protein